MPLGTRSLGDHCIISVFWRNTELLLSAIVCNDRDGIYIFFGKKHFKNIIT